MGRTLTFTGTNQQSYSVRDRINTLYLTLDGAAGGDGGAAGIDDPNLGGTGGLIEAEISVSDGEVLDIYPASGGQDGDDESNGGAGGAAGDSAWAAGGAGGDAGDDGAGGGGGGGAVVVVAPNGDLLVADAGAGGRGVSGGGGGGGARGGTGGVSTNADDEEGFDAAGSGNGGDGNGGDGGTEAGSAWTVTTATDGGATTADGTVTLVEGGPDSCGVSVVDETTEDITLELSSSSDADGYYVYRSDTQGFAPTTSNRIADVTRDGSSQTFVDSPFDEGDTKYFVVEAFNNDGVTEARADGTTVLPAPILDVGSQSVAGDDISVDWILGSEDETAVELWYSRSEDDEFDNNNDTWTKYSELAPGTETETITDRKDGDRYRLGVVVVGSDTRTVDPSNQDTNLS